MGKHTAAIFDLDGTLLDSMKVWERVDRDFLMRRSLPFTPDYTEAVSAMSFDEAARYTVGRFRLMETPEELIREWNAMVAQEYAHRIALKPGARECLRFLQSRGVALGVATALSEGLYGPALQNNGVYGCFGAFASVTETARGKGFPDVYLLCAERLGAPPEGCLVFEDVLPGLRGAKAAGMAAVGVRDASSGLSEKDALSVADGFIRSLKEVMKPKFYDRFL
jgi:HAD superfamily hydrolase (TIGR01509 family)